MDTELLVLTVPEKGMKPMSFVEMSKIIYLSTKHNILHNLNLQLLIVS
jgi:hypothetical protein